MAFSQQLPKVCPIPEESEVLVSDGKACPGAPFSQILASRAQSFLPTESLHVKAIYPFG